MDRGEKGDAIVAQLVAHGVPEHVPPMLSEALYTLSESGRWPDHVDSVSEEQAIRCWQLVEWLRSLAKFPADLRM
jgi:hypothetical protein